MYQPYEQILACDQGCGILIESFNETNFFIPPPPPSRKKSERHSFGVVLGMGLVGQNSTFSEHGHVAYQIKQNHECSNMVANILSADPPRQSRCSNMVANILPTDSRPWGWMESGQNSTYCGHGHVTYQIKENYKCSNMVAGRPSPDPWYRISRSKFNFFRT